MSPNSTNAQWKSEAYGGGAVSINFFSPPLSNGPALTFPLTFYISVLAYGGHSS